MRFARQEGNVHTSMTTMSKIEHANDKCHEVTLMVQPISVTYYTNRSLV